VFHIWFVIVVLPVSRRLKHIRLLLVSLSKKLYRLLCTGWFQEPIWAWFNKQYCFCHNPTRSTK